MKPPICCVCGRACSPDGELVTFRKTASDRAWDRRSDEGLVGHPPYADWFCTRHFPRAEALHRRGLTLDGALRRMRRPAWLDGLLVRLYGEG